jgi:hypothetical protein
MLLGPPGSEIGTPGELRPGQGDGDRLFNLAPCSPPGQQYSRVYRGRRELIDHVLVSRALLERVARVGSGTGIAAGPVLRSVDDDPNDQRDKPGSDHAPITATLDV